MNKIYATGKRKTSVAKVWLTNGKGELKINNQSIDEWLGGHDSIKKRVLEPIESTKQQDSIDIVAVIFGGGYSSQANALRHGISKALSIYDENFRTILKPKGFLVRDARVVERKKPGKKKARKSGQFSKR